MRQISIFEELYETYKITKPIRLIELFGGIGSQAKALTNLKANFEHYKLVEFDKYPVASYNAIHGTNFTTKDITQTHASDLEIVDRDKYEYIMTYSFPCQDLSLAGKRQGMTKGSETRSGLLWEVERILIECGDNLPQILLMKNVPQVIGEGNVRDFCEWQLFLEKKGYSNYHQILNAKDYGIPQNRERCFMISILGEYCYCFPQKIPLTTRLCDVLEKEVDKSYYLSEEKIQKIANWNSYQKPLECAIDITDASKVSPTLTARGAGEEHSGMILIKEPKVKKVGNYSPSGHNAASIVDADGIAPTVMENHGTITAVKIKDTKVIGGIGEMKSNDGTQFYMQDRIYDGDVSIAIATSCNPFYKVDEEVIRKMTPRECWRLMGFSDEDFDKASKVNTKSQLYKQAGNSIVVNVLMAIFKQLL